MTSWGIASFAITDEICFKYNKAVIKKWYDETYIRLE
jgi:hypothetical protein